jgi:hypothetical protein
MLAKVQALGFFEVALYLVAGNIVVLVGLFGSEALARRQKA